jgi:hypothetical protein
MKTISLTNEIINSVGHGIGKLPIEQSAHGHVARESFKNSSDDIYRQFQSMCFDITLAVVDEVGDTLP